MTSQAPAPSTLSARERIIAAYEELLIKDGMRAATLDAVAATAGVSKGGLLYHFKSKEALTGGLIEKLRELAAIDSELMAQDSAGSANYYVRTSIFSGSTFDLTMVAAMRLVQDDDAGVKEAFIDIHTVWYRLILEDVKEPALARAIMLLGDGMYYNAAIFGMSAGMLGMENVEDASVDVESLLRVVERIRK